MSRPAKVEQKTVTMSYANLEAAVVSFLFSIKAIPPAWDVIDTDLPVELNEEGLVEFDIQIAKPIERQLRLVTEEEAEAQLELFETFETIHVEEIVR